LGDSRSVTSNTWPEILLTALNALDNPVKTWFEFVPRNWAVGGIGILNLAANINTYITEHLQDYDADRRLFFVNIGANDNNRTRAVWKPAAQNVVDALVAKWPNAEIYFAKPWHRAYPAAMDSIAVWIDEIVATNPTSCYVGHDERIWLEGGDDGATMSSDGVHYSTAGQIECANQWKTILGY
jgi:hypothetical protein